jgi:predicted nucleotide-binding protein (sugar kinase/HSP70/actin superfamily)
VSKIGVVNWKIILLSIIGLTIRKAYHPDFRHRAIRHHSLGIKECIEKFGDYIVNSDNKKVPVKLIGEQHVKEDCGYVPSLSDWLTNLNAKPFMVKTVKIERSVA